MAFEIAQQLKASGQQIDLLVLFDTPNALQAFTPLEDDMAYWQWKYPEHTTSPQMDRLKSLGAEAQIDYILSQLRRSQKMHPRFSLPNARQFLKVQKSNIQVLARYKAQAYSDRITLFRTIDQSEWFNKDSQLGWVKLTREGVEVYEIPGRHDTLFKYPHVETVAKYLDKCLFKASKEAVLSKY